MSLLEWARRRAGAVPPRRAIDALRSGPDDAAATTGLPEAALEGVRTFYDHLHGATGPMTCVGTACAFAGGERAPERPVHCLGRCYEAPARSGTASTPIPATSMASDPAVLRHRFAKASPLADYALPDGAAILAAVIASGLRGRGGAAYPTGAKWKAARETPAADRCVVANGDEGDPGAFVDRLLLEEAPHSILAGMVACARAIDARQGIVFIRGEYPTAVETMSAAIADARGRGLLGALDVRVVAGAGSYVAGEETALLRSIEGLRAEPAPKPPYPAVRGLHGLPTIVQNVETLAVVPRVVRNGRAANTKAVCLSGAVRHPGVVEIDLGTPLRRVLIEAGGGPPAPRRWSMALVGGPMGRIVPESAFDIPLAFDTLPGMGHGGIVVFDESVRPRDLALHLMEFARRESCGSCTPCRVGSAQLATRATIADLTRLLRTMEEGSLCGFGQGVPRPFHDLVRHYAAELLP